MCRTHAVKEQLLEISDLLHVNVCHKPLCAAIEHSYLLPYRHRAVLSLNQQTFVLTSLVKSHRSDLVHIGRELGERFKFAELRLIYFQGSGHFLHGFDLCRTSDTGYRYADIDGRTETGIEKR